MSDIKRVILTCNYSPWSRYSGGGQRSAHALGKAFAARGIETHVVFTKPRWESIAVPEGLPYNLHWASFAGVRGDGRNPLRALNVLSVLKTVKSLLELQVGATALHAQGEEGALLHTLTSPSVCYILTPRDSALHDPIARVSRGRFWLRPKFIALRHGLRHASAVCPTSEFSAAQICLRFRLSRKRVTVVPNGIAQAFMEVDRRHIPVDAPLVYAGRLSASKGVYELLEAWLARSADPELWIIGEGPEEAGMRRQIRTAGVDGRVRWLGWCSPEKTASIMAQARAVVLPSYEESFGNTMVEALASGAPLVTTRAGSIPEVVGDPEHAWWAEVADAASLGQAIEQCLENPARAEKQAKRAQRFARATYAWDATAGRYLDVYRAALGM